MKNVSYSLKQRTKMKLIEDSKVLRYIYFRSISINQFFEIYTI